MGWQRKIGIGALDAEIKKFENKLKTVTDLKARNILIIKLNTFLRLAGKKVQYRKETQEDKNLEAYDRRTKT